MQVISVYWFLYPESLLNSLISFSSFLILSLGFLCTVSCHLQTVRALLLLFWSRFLLFLFLLWIAVARTSRTMLNNRGERGHPCLVPDLRGNAFSFSPLRIMFFAGLSYMAFTGGSDGKASVCNAGDLGLIPGSGRSPGEGNGSPLQYSCLENPMDRGVW